MAIELTKENFKATTSSGTCLIDFWATWCGPCRMMSPVLEEIAAERPDLKVCKVNVDEQDEIAAAYRVMSIPMFVLMKDGQPVASAVGYMPKATLLAQLGL